MSDFSLQIDTDGVALITWDRPGHSMNVLTFDGAAILGDLVDQALTDPSVKGIVITSGKADFAAGMDLALLAGMKEDGAQAAFDGVMALHHLLRRIERAGMDPATGTGGKPIATALPGSALGIGLEIPLATHRIFAADAPQARIGLPEIRVGLFPGGGGTTRLVRKLGPVAAAPLLLEGRLTSPHEAVALKVIDAVVSDPVAAARAWVLSMIGTDLRKPWDLRGWHLPGGGPYDPAGFMTFVGAAAMVQARTMGAFPAPQALLAAVYEGAQVDFDTALRIEARWFTSILMNPSSAAMIRTLFIDRKALEREADHIAAGDTPTARLGVIGAGMMGAEIAHAAAAARIEVVLIDTTAALAERGKARAADLLDQAIRRGRATAPEKAATLGRINAGADPAPLAACDLVIEAVFEDPALKAQVLGQAAALLPPNAILATNTSTLPIADLARATAAPERFIGIHFFSPVARMKLVEVIRGRQTGEAALARALGLVRRLGKTPIIVNDARFFYANRCVNAYIGEGVRMVAEGVAPALIENAARRVGMPVGPLQLVDEISIELCLRIAAATRTAMGNSYPDDESDTVLAPMAATGRLGRKAGAGFYDYDANGRRGRLWDDLATRWPHARSQPDPTTVQDRLIVAQVLEAVRALQEGVLTDVRAGDVGAVLGWGFAPWSGGPFSWLDLTGPPQAMRRARALADAHGPRFTPPELLRGIAAGGETFRRRPATTPA